MGPGRATRGQTLGKFPDGSPTVSQKQRCPAMPNAQHRNTVLKSLLASDAEAGIDMEEGGIRLTTKQARMRRAVERLLDALRIAYPLRLGYPFQRCSQRLIGIAKEPIIPPYNAETKNTRIVAGNGLMRRMIRAVVSRDPLGKMRSRFGETAHNAEGVAQADVRLHKEDAIRTLPSDVETL